MRADLRHARELGAPGAVIGAISGDGDIDAALTASLRADAPAMQLTFHRAFDVCRDPYVALEALIDLGIDRVLTSGQANTAWDGRELIGQLVTQAAGRIVVMAGGGVDERNAGPLVRSTGVRELHVRGTRRHEDQGSARPISFRKALPSDETVRAVTDPGRIASIRTAANQG